MSEQMLMEFNDPFKGREATVSKCQASRGLGGLSEMLSPMGDESKTTRFSGGLLYIYSLFKMKRITFWKEK